MSESEFKDLPQVRISTSEIIVLEQVISTYKIHVERSAYLVNNTTFTANKTKARLTVFKNLHLRLQSFLILDKATKALFPQSEQKEQSSPNQETGYTYIPLTVDEMQVLIDSISFFADGVKKLVPASSDRDGVLKDLEGFRLKIVRMLPGSK